MPSTSHLTALGVEEELDKLKTCVASSSQTAQMMCNRLTGVGDLYELVEEFIHLPSSQLCLQGCLKKQMDKQLDCSLGLLDLIGAVRDSLVSMREQVQDLQSAIQRKESTVNDSRKKAQKMIKDCLQVIEANECQKFTLLYGEIFKGKYSDSCLSSVEFDFNGDGFDFSEDEFDFDDTTHSLCEEFLLN